MLLDEIYEASIIKVLMLTLEAPRALQFIEDFEEAYRTVPPYKSQDPHILQDAFTNPGFLTRRRSALEVYIASNGEIEQIDSHAFLAEWASYISLIAPLENAGYSVSMASPQFEHGRPGRHGIDLVVGRTVGDIPDPLLGINIKLQRLKESTASDSHRYDPAIEGPSLNVSLGNWAVRTREQEELDIRKWIESLAVPKAIQSGKIPYIPSLRNYIISGIFSTLNIYAWKWEQYCAGKYHFNDSQLCLIPDHEEKDQVFEEKLITAHTLFNELYTNMQVM